MNLITKKIIMDTLSAADRFYSVPEGFILSDDALEYLVENKILVFYQNSVSDKIKFSKPLVKDEWATNDCYVNSYTGEEIDAKPEAMTHLIENILVYKDDPRIIFRGKMDSLQSVILEAQIYFKALHRDDLLGVLDELLEYSRKILGSEVLNKNMPDIKLMGFSAEEIKERSHNPEKYFGLKQMVLVNCEQGAAVVKLNYLRALARECELSAVQAFRVGDAISNHSIIQALNRLSSCFHILMYNELAKIK